MRQRAAEGFSAPLAFAVRTAWRGHSMARADAIDDRRKQSAGIRRPWVLAVTVPFEDESGGRGGPGAGAVAAAAILGALRLGTCHIRKVAI